MNLERVLRKYNWGIIGTGTIANLFAEGLDYLEDANILAVGSRTQASADAFARKWSADQAYGSYADLYADPEVEIVYIGTPHNFHFENVRDALNAGKHVLCEKAFTINAVEARELVHLASEKNLFLMEAMWNRFQPWYGVVNQLLSEDRIGEIHHLKADLSFGFDVGLDHRIFNLELAGGSLLDLGVYPIALASAILGPPEEILAAGHLCETGVDDQVSLIFKYGGGATAELGCSSRYLTKNNATIHGSKGYIEIHGMIVRPHLVSIQADGNELIEIDTTPELNGYQYEAQAVMEIVGAGQLEHPLMPLNETIQIMETMDQIRASIGVKYPGE